MSIEPTIVIWWEGRQGEKKVGMLWGRGVNVSQMHCTNMVRQLSELIA